jgi:hypothetical protein
MFKNDLHDFNYMIILVFKFFYGKKYNYHITTMMDKSLENFPK